MTLRTSNSTCGTATTSSDSSSSLNPSKTLAPEWTPEQAQAEKKAAEKEKLPTKIPTEAATVLKGTDFDSNAKPQIHENGHNPFNTPPHTPSGNDRESMAPSTVGWNEDASTLKSGATNHTKKTAQAFEEVDALQPFTIQPFREEISRIIAIYVAEGGSRMLNLSAREKAGLLKALAVTTHPSAFREVIATVEWTLRHQAHPNFIRWTICNGNPPRQMFARGLGLGGIVAAIVYAIVITLSGANRGWRALAFLGFLHRYCYSVRCLEGYVRRSPRHASPSLATVGALWRC